MSGILAEDVQAKGVGKWGGGGVRADKSQFHVFFIYNRNTGIFSPFSALNNEYGAKMIFGI